MKRASKRERQLVLENPNTEIGFYGNLLVGLSLILMLITLPLSKWMCIVEYQRAIIFRLGRLLSGGAKGPGLFFVLPCTDNFINVDMRTITFDIPPQEVLPRDSVTVCVDGVVYYQVQNPTLAVVNITNANASTQLLAQTTLRNVLGSKNLAGVLSDHEDIAQFMQVIAAEGEMNALWALKEASLVIAESPSALQLRYLQTLNTFAAEKNSTTIFPLPLEVL